MSDRLAAMKKMPSKRDELIPFLKTLSRAVRDLLCVKKDPDGRTVFFADRADAEAVSRSASARRIISLYDGIADAVPKLAANVNVQAVLMLLITKN